MQKVSCHCPFIILIFPESLKGEKPYCCSFPKGRFFFFFFFGCNLSERILHLEVLSENKIFSLTWKTTALWKVFSPSKYVSLPADLQEESWSSLSAWPCLLHPSDAPCWASLRSETFVGIQRREASIFSPTWDLQLSLCFLQGRAATVLNCFHFTRASMEYPDFLFCISQNKYRLVCL